MHGPNYHWVVDLYERLNLPVVWAVVEALHKATLERIVNLAKQKTEGKQRRIHMKVARSEDQESRTKSFRNVPSPKQTCAQVVT